MTVAVGASVCVPLWALAVVAVAVVIAEGEGETARRVLCRHGSADQQRVWLGLFGGPRHCGIDLSNGVCLLFACEMADERSGVVLEAFAKAVLSVVELVVDVSQSSVVKTVLNPVISAVMVMPSRILAAGSCGAPGLEFVSQLLNVISHTADRRGTRILTSRLLDTSGHRDRLDKDRVEDGYCPVDHAARQFLLRCV